MPKGFSYEPWVAFLQADPRPWLLESDEPYARLITLTSLAGRDKNNPDVRKAHSELLNDKGVISLIERLPEWEKDAVTAGHNSSSFAPNILNLLADMGVRAGDHPSIERILDRMLLHMDKDGRFQSLGRWRAQPQESWGTLLCDTHAITEVLVRFGRGDDIRVRASLNCMAADIADTPQGKAWPCIPDPATGFRGPGRKADACPQVTLEALRVFGRLPPGQRPRVTLDAARAYLGIWRNRGHEKPYMFGHGRQFKTVKWPTFWYDVHIALETLSLYPELWTAPSSHVEDRQSLCELGACMVAYNFGLDGRVTPRSCYKGFEQFSFGRKKQPSPFTTAKLCAILRRMSDVADGIRAVDVLRLGSSKGGTGVPVPPKMLLSGPRESR